MLPKDLSHIYHSLLHIRRDRLDYYKDIGLAKFRDNNLLILKEVSEQVSREWGVDFRDHGAMLCAEYGMQMFLFGEGCGPWPKKMKGRK